MHMCKATGNSHDAPVSQPFLNFVLDWKFHTILNMGPKLRARKADEPFEELSEVRRKKAKLSKWLPEGEKATATQEQEETEADPGDQPGESAPSQITEPGKNDKIYKLICTIIFFYLYKMYVKKLKRPSNVENNAYLYEYA